MHKPQSSNLEYAEREQISKQDPYMKQRGTDSFFNSGNDQTKNEKEKGVFLEK